MIVSNPEGNAQRIQNCLTDRIAQQTLRGEWNQQLISNTSNCRNPLPPQNHVSEMLLYVYSDYLEQWNDQRRRRWSDNCF
jgi:hypothetical protein